MKILDYLTIASLTGAKISMELNKFAVDIMLGLIQFKNEYVYATSKLMLMGCDEQIINKIIDISRANKVDINSDVVPIERGAVIVVSESKKLGNNKPEKFSMYLVSQTSSRYIQGFETLKEVHEAYARLFSSKVFNLDGSSSSIYKKVEEVVNYSEMDKN